MPQNNPQINPSEVTWDDQPKTVDPTGIVWDSDKKKVLTSSNGTADSNQQSPQDGNLLKSPTTILNESSGGGSLVPKIGDVYSDVSDGAALTLPNKEEQQKLFPTQTIESLKKNFADDEKIPVNESLAVKNLKGIYAALDATPNIPTSGGLTKLVSKAYISSTIMALEGMEGIPKSVEDIAYIHSDPALISEFPEKVTQAVFGAAGTILPPLIAFNTAIEGVKSVTPEQYVSATMSPFSTGLDNGVFIIPSVGGSAPTIYTFDKGKITKGQKSLATWGDLIYQMALAKGFHGLAEKIQTNAPLETPEEKQQMAEVENDAVTTNKAPFTAEALNKIPEQVPDETKIAAAPIIQKKLDAQTEIQNTQKDIADLETKKQATDVNFQPEIDKQIDQKKDAITEQENNINSANEEIKKTIDQPITEQKKQDTRTEEPTIEEKIADLEKKKKEELSKLTATPNILGRIPQKELDRVSGESKAIQDKHNAEIEKLKSEPTPPVEQNQPLVENKPDSEVSGSKLGENKDMGEGAVLPGGKLKNGTAVILTRKDKRVEGTDYFEITASDKDGNYLGHASFDIAEDGSIFPMSLQTKPEFQRQGVQTAIYDALEKQGYKITEGRNSKSEAGAAFEKNRLTSKSEPFPQDTPAKVVSEEGNVKNAENVGGEKVSAALPEVKTPRQIAREERIAAKAKLDELRNRQGIIDNPEEKAQRLFDYHKALVKEAKEAIREGVKTVEDFVSDFGGKVTVAIKRAWDEAFGGDVVKDASQLGYDEVSADNSPSGFTNPETGIKNAVTLEERGQRGLGEVEVEARRSFGEAFDKGKAAVDSGKIDPRTLAQNLAKKPRALNAEESVALIYDRMRLQNEHRQVMSAFEEASKSGDDAAKIEAATRLASIEDAINTNDIAARKTGYEQGLGLAARRMMIKQDYSLSNILQRARVANDGKEVLADVRAKIEQLSKQRDDLLNQLEEHKAKIIDLQKELATRPERKSIKEQSKKLADKVRGLKTKPLTFKDANGNPIIVRESNFYNEAVELVAQSIELGGSIADAIQKGIEHIKNQKFYNELSDEDKAAVQKQFEEHISNEMEDDAARLEKLKTQLRKKSAEVGAKLMNVDVEQAKKTKKPPPLDEEARNLQAQVNKKQNQLEIEVQKLQQKNRTKIEKGLDFLAKWRRAVLLTSVTTIGKLTSAATQRIITTPLEEIVGGAISQIPGISKIAGKAQREGMFSPEAEAKSITQLFQKATYKDVWETAKTGRSELDYLYGKQNVLPPTLLDFFGQLHAALKVMPKRAEFFRAFEKRTAFAIKNGVDVSDPVVQASLAAESYADANRAILMQDNKITDAYKVMINYLQSQGTGGKVKATAAKIIFPIVKIPTNYVAEATSYGIGGLKALYKVIAAGGAEKLTPEEADYVMRALKKQGLGVGLLALGYFNANNIGGYYQNGEKRSDSDAQAGGMKLFGKDIPRWLLHSPALEMLQVGATVRRVQEAYAQKGKEGGTVEGIYQGGAGLLSEVPFLDQPAQLAEAFQNTNKVEGYLGQLGSSMIVPPDVNKFATAQDIDENGNPIFRKPQGFIQEVETKIPGLREKVPINEPKEWGQKQQSILELMDNKPLPSDDEMKTVLFNKTDLNKSEEDSFDLFKKKAATVSEYGIKSRELNLTKSLSGIISNKKKAEILNGYKEEKGNKFEDYKKFALDHNIISPAVIAIMEGRNQQNDTEKPETEEAQPDNVLIEQAQ